MACRVSSSDDVNDAQAESDADPVELVDRQHALTSEVLRHLRLGHADCVAELLLRNAFGGVFACLYFVAEYGGDCDRQRSRR